MVIPLGPAIVALTYSPLGKNYGSLLWMLALTTILTGLLLVYKGRHNDEETRR